MGTSTNAILAYGYELGGDNDGWKIAEAGPYGELRLPWLTEDELDNAEFDFAEEVMLRLAREAGHDVKYTSQAEEETGLRVESHCSAECAEWLLAAKVITAYRGHPKNIDFAALERERVERDWDSKLERACQVLGITPTQGKPRWVLCSYWG